jgi:hypothetical protein
MGTSGGFTPTGTPECPYAPRMTRAAALALRAGGGLLENCVVVITDGPVIGTAGNTSPTEIELNPTSPTELGLTARVHTTFAASAWAGTYDIDLGTAGSITELTDDFGNTVKDVDADSPTVHGQFPWHLGSATLRDNYIEDSTLPGWDVQAGSITDNRIVASTINLTAKTAGNMTGSTFATTTVVTGQLFTASLSTFTGSTLNLGDASTANFLSSQLTGATITRDATATGALSFTRTRLGGSAVTLGAGSTGGASAVDSEIAHTSALNIDPGSGKGISVSGSDLHGYTIRTQDTGGGSATMFRCTAFGKPNAATADSLLIRGVDGSGISVTNSTIDGFSGAGAGLGSIDLNGAASVALLNNADIHNSRINVGPGAGSFQSTGVELSTAIINALGPAPDGRLTINQTTMRGGTITHGLLATASLSVTGGRVEGGGLIELLSGPRGLAVTDTEVIGTSIIRQTTTTTAAVVNSNTVSNCRVIDTGRIIFSDSAAAGQAGNSVVRSTIKGSSLGGGADGILTVTGLTAFLLVDSVTCQGVVTLTDVPSGALSAGTAFHDLRVGPASTLTYTGGDATAKQIRNLTVEDLSSLTLTALTGSAGAGLADVFAGVIRGQSVMTVTGARVAGQPVRNFTVDNGSTLNVAADGTVLQCAFRNGATLNTGAFRHSESVIEGAFSKTATAANVNRLCNKSFDDWI